MSESPQPPPVERKLTPAVWLATGLGVGLVAPAPGTVGALWGLLWAWLLLLTDNPWWWLTVPAGILLGIPLCTRAAKDLGGEKDPGAIVWDEIATVPLVFAALPMLMPWLQTEYGESLIPRSATEQFAWWWLPIGFALHRCFDITKPPPCRRLEKLPAGWGVMLDDVVAALYAAVGMTISAGSPVIFWIVLWNLHGPPR